MYNLPMCFLWFPVCAFPYVMAFTADTIEIRLIVNGNLVHTMSMPDLTLISSKVDIRHTSFSFNVIKILLKIFSSSCLTTSIGLALPSAFSRHLFLEINFTKPSSRKS